MKKSDLEKNLSTIQQIIIRGFFTFLGMALLIIAFYAVSLKELLLSDKDADANYILAAFGVLSIYIALDLSRILRIVEYIGQKFGYKKKNDETDAV